MPPRYAFDSDVLIYAATASNPQGEVIRVLLQHAPPQHHLGSLLLYPELLSKPIRLGQSDELRLLQGYLARLHLVDITADMALLATQFSAAYRLKAADALHLGAAVQAGADAFVTNNRKDFRPREVLEIRVLFPEELG